MMEEWEHFDIPGAHWVDLVTLGSLYEEQVDAGHIDGKWRHRAKVRSDEPFNMWREGRAPAYHMDTRSGARQVDWTMPTKP